jgi:hypothetical protein
LRKLGDGQGMCLFAKRLERGKPMFERDPKNHVIEHRQPNARRRCLGSAEVDVVDGAYGGIAPESQRGIDRGAVRPLEEEKEQFPTRTRQSYPRRKGAHVSFLLASRLANPEDGEEGVSMSLAGAQTKLAVAIGRWTSRESLRRL